MFTVQLNVSLVFVSYTHIVAGCIQDNIRANSKVLS